MNRYACCSVAKHRGRFEAGYSPQARCAQATCPELCHEGSGSRLAITCEVVTGFLTLHLCRRVTACSYRKCRPFTVCRLYCVPATTWLHPRATRDSFLTLGCLRTPDSLTGVRGALPSSHLTLRGRSSSDCNERRQLVEVHMSPGRRYSKEALRTRSSASRHGLLTGYGSNAAALLMTDKQAES